MKVHVIGNKGVVGKATFDTLSKSKIHAITGNDINEEIPNDRDIYFFCTPERITEKIFFEVGNEECLRVIRSTMRPDIVKELFRQNHNICVNPEFLKAHSPFWDCYFSKMVLIGQCCEKHGSIVEDIWSLVRAPAYKTGLLEAVYIKLISNVHASMEITFWNEMQRVAEGVGVDIYEVARLLPMLDERVSRYGSYPGQAYGGACLPKDVNQFITMCDDNEIGSDWFKLMDNINDDYPEGNIIRGGL